MQILEPLLSRISLPLHSSYFNTCFFRLSCSYFPLICKYALRRNSPFFAQNSQDLFDESENFLSILFASFFQNPIYLALSSLRIQEILSQFNGELQLKQSVPNENNLILQQIYVTSRLHPELQLVPCSPSMMMECNRFTTSNHKNMQKTIHCFLDLPNLNNQSKAPSWCQKLSADVLQLVQTQLRLVCFSWPLLISS